MAKTTSSTESRVSVLVADAGIDWSRWRELGDSAEPPVLRLVQYEREDANDFALRVADRVARLGRERTMLDRLSLVLQDERAQELQSLRSDVATAITLHLIRSRTPLTIRFAGTDEEVDTDVSTAVV